MRITLPLGRRADRNVRQTAVGAIVCQRRSAVHAGCSLRRMARSRHHRLLPSTGAAGHPSPAAPKAPPVFLDTDYGRIRCRRRWGTWRGWCCRSPSSGNRGAPSPPGGDGCTFPWVPSIHAHRTTRPAAFFLCSHSRHFLETINLGSDGKVLKALALAVLQLWPLAAGSLQTQPAPLLGHPPQLRLPRRAGDQRGRRALQPVLAPREAGVSHATRSARGIRATPCRVAQTCVQETGCGTSGPSRIMQVRLHIHRADTDPR